ncbi:MAG TPA: hypothetical protein VER09_00795 [Pseudomonas sp.]|nr:hypothetical protein [Pseudomonas sp.]
MGYLVRPARAVAAAGDLGATMPSGHDQKQKQIPLKKPYQIAGKAFAGNPLATIPVI